MKKMLSAVFTAVVILIPFYSFAQGEGNIWHFGSGAGIDFNSGSPVAIPGYVNTWEGCADICSSSGSLLFSTDGVTVYNATGAVMVTGLLGNFSSTQSSVIVPYPGSASKYYIFTVDDVAGSDGLCYTIVDMTLNGGLGGVTVQNAPLLTPTCEKITAVHASNGIDFWMITHKFGNDEYYAYRITPAGIDPPIISATGVAVNDDYYTVGYLKSSPDGNKLASVFWNFNVINYFQVSDFDDATGVVSNTVDVPVGLDNLYGCCFSPDNTKLYVATYGGSGYIYQYDLTNPNYATNPIIVSNNESASLGGMQVAPDGKIYIAQDGALALGVINNPNALGTSCNFVESGFALTFPSGIGLPDFIDQFIVTNPCAVSLGDDQSFCGDFSITLNAGSGDSAFLWQDGSSQQFLTVNTPGTYWVIKTLSDGCVSGDTVVITQFPQPAIDLGSDTAVCTAGTVTLHAGVGFQNYFWSNGSTTQNITPLVSGIYSITATDVNGCIAKDTIALDFHGPQFSLGNDTTVCSGDSVLLNAGSIYKTYYWSTGTFDSLNMVYGTGTYSVTVYDFQGCHASDTIQVHVSTPVADLGNDTLLCGTLNFNLNPGGGFNTYHWNTNNSTATINIQNPGIYAVTVTDQYGCFAHDSIAIANSDPHIDLGIDTIICNHTSAQLTAPDGFATYHWSNGNNAQSVTVSLDGSFGVTVTDAFGCTASAAKIISIDTPAVFIGNDTSTCNGKGIVFDAGNNFTAFIWNEHSTDQIIRSTGAGVYAVTVTDFNGCTANDTAVVSYADCVEVDVPTAFSPDGNGHNDFFHILNSEDFIFGAIQIYNRWGQQIYHSDKADGYWNGKYNNADCEVGVYVYVITGKNYLNHDVFKQGNVTLLR